MKKIQSFKNSSVFVDSATVGRMETAHGCASNLSYRETTNGVRIKTWQGGSGYVRGVRFENVRMEDVANPIIIDQFYCDSPTTCQNQTSAVQISQIVYRNISGTTKSKQAIKFACSNTVPCSNLVLSNVNLEKKDGTVETYCNSAQSFGYGLRN